MKSYVWIFIALFFIAIIGQGLYEQILKDGKSAKSKRISCQQKVTAFERVYSSEKIKTTQKQLEYGNYELTSSAQKAVYAKSKLFDYVNLSDMNAIAIEKLQTSVKKRELSDDKLKISYYIYENDIKDPGKKTEKSKLYAGYVVFRFSDENDELVYQVQIDFMDKQGKDLPDSIRCAVESFTTIKE